MSEIKSIINFVPWFSFLIFSPVVVVSDSSTVELRFVLSSLAPEDCDTTRTDSQQLVTPLQGFEVEQQVRVQRKTQAIKKASTLDEAWGGMFNIYSC